MFKLTEFKGTATIHGTDREVVYTEGMLTIVGLTPEQATALVCGFNKPAEVTVATATTAPANVADVVYPEPEPAPKPLAEPKPRAAGGSALKRAKPETETISTPERVSQTTTESKVEEPKPEPKAERLADVVPIKKPEPKVEPAPAAASGVGFSPQAVEVLAVLKSKNRLRLRDVLVEAIDHGFDTKEKCIELCEQIKASGELPVLNAVTDVADRVGYTWDHGGVATAG